jgi:hypothetical protein
MQQNSVAISLQKVCITAEIWPIISEIQRPLYKENDKILPQLVNRNKIKLKHLM